MSQIFYGSACMTQTIRCAEQLRQVKCESGGHTLPRQAEDDPKARIRPTTGDAAMGLNQPCSMFLTSGGAVIVASRRHTLLLLDDCLYDLQPTMPHLTCSSLHR